MRMAITNDREYRSIEFDLGKEEEMIVEGTAIVFDSPTVMYELDGIKYYEVIERGALDGAKIDDVVLNVDHVGKPAAKTRNKTLELTLHDDRLDIRADLSKNATGRELHEDILNGFFEKMSFSFTIADEEYDRENRTRIIKKIDRLYDVSAVTVPAYNQTSIIARSFFSAEAEKELAEARELELRKRKLQLQIRLGKDEVNE